MFAVVIHYKCTTAIIFQQLENTTQHHTTSQIGALRRRRAFIIAQLYNVGQSIRSTEAELLTGPRLPEVRGVSDDTRVRIVSLPRPLLVGEFAVGTWVTATAVSESPREQQVSDAAANVFAYDLKRATGRKLDDWVNVLRRQQSRRRFAACKKSPNVLPRTPRQLQAFTAHDPCHILLAEQNIRRAEHTLAVCASHYGATVT